MLFRSSGRGGGERGSRHGRAGSDVDAGRPRRDAGHRRWNAVWSESATDNVLLRMSVGRHQLPGVHDLLPSMPCAHL